MQVGRLRAGMESVRDHFLKHVQLDLYEYLTVVFCGFEASEGQPSM